MAGFNYAPLARMADRLIKLFGQTVTLEMKRTSGDEWAPSVDRVQKDVSVVPVDQEVRNQTSGLVEGTQDQIIMAAARDIEPKVSDRVLLDGNWREIETLKTVRPGGATLIYIAWLKA